MFSYWSHSSTIFFDPLTWNNSPSTRLSINPQQFIMLSMSCGATSEARHLPTPRPNSSLSHLPIPIPSHRLLQTVVSKASALLKLTQSINSHGLARSSPEWFCAYAYREPESQAPLGLSQHQLLPGPLIAKNSQVLTTGLTTQCIWDLK